MLVIKKVVIPAAGLGTRLFPATKEQPKEMLPIFASTSNGDLLVKPVVEMVFEQLFDAGFREFCYVVGKGKRSIEDHFTPDPSSVRMLESLGRNGQAVNLGDFHENAAGSQSPQFRCGLHSADFSAYPR